MTAPMPEAMSPREKVAELIYDRLGIGSDNESVEQVSGEILAALASSGDHAELARLADEAADFGVPAKVDPAVLNALIAEVAALREDLNHKHEACQIAQDQAMENGSRAREAERKLAEAVGLNDRAAELMRQCTDPERFEGVSTLNVYANMRAWLSALPPAPGADA